MKYRSSSPCVPFQQVGQSLVKDRHFYKAAFGQKKKKKKKKRETENATHYIKGSHCHGDQYFHNSHLGHLSELRPPKRLPLTQHGSWQQPAADSLVSLLSQPFDFFTPMWESLP